MVPMLAKIKWIAFLAKLTKLDLFFFIDLTIILAYKTLLEQLCSTFQTSSLVTHKPMHPAQMNLLVLYIIHQFLIHLSASAHEFWAQNISSTQKLTERIKYIFNIFTTQCRSQHVSFQQMLGKFSLILIFILLLSFLPLMLTTFIFYSVP